MLESIVSSIASWPPLIYLPTIIIAIIALVFIAGSSLKIFCPGRKICRLTLHPKAAVIIFIAFTFLYAALLTWLQYWTWHFSAFGKYFLPPYAEINYFISYSFFHFWINSLMGLVVSFLLYLTFLSPKLLRRKTLEKEEALSLFLFFLLSSWPGLIITVPIFLLLAVVYYAFLIFVLKKKNASLLPPLIVSFIISFFFGAEIIYRLALPSL